MSAPECCVKFCENQKVPGSAYSFHHLRFDWTLELQGKNALKDVLKKKIICSKHFKPEFIIERNGIQFLTPNALPTEFLTPEKSSQKPQIPKIEKKKPETEKPRIKSPVIVHQSSNDEKHKYKSLFEKYEIKDFSINWNNIKLKCSGPNCGLIKSNSMFVAQISSSGVRPRYLMLCENHRDITEPDTYCYLTQRLGTVISLRNRSPESADPDNENKVKENESEQPVIENESEESDTPLSNKIERGVKRKLKSSDHKKKSMKTKVQEKIESEDDKSRESPIETTVRRTRSSAPIREEDIPELIEWRRKPVKENQKKEEKIETSNENESASQSKDEKGKSQPAWRSIFKPANSGTQKKRKRGRPFKRSTSSASDSTSRGSTPALDDKTETQETMPDAPDENTAKDAEKTDAKKEAMDVICLDSDSNGDEPIITPHPGQVSNNVKLETKCCYPGCNREESVSIIKVGLPPDFEYLVVCGRHRHCFANIQEILPVSAFQPLIKQTLSANEPYILEEGEVPPSPPTPDTYEPMSDEELPPPINPSTTVKETIPVQRVKPTVLNNEDPVELNAQGQMLVSRKCISMTGPSNVPKKYILEEFADGSIVYTPAPPDLPLGICTKKQIAFYKAKQSTQRNSNLTTQVSNPVRVSVESDNILSARDIVPVPNPNPGMPIADVSKSELVYIRGQPFLLTSIQGFPNSTNNVPSFQQPQQNIQQPQPRVVIPPPSVSFNQSAHSNMTLPVISSVSTLNPNPTTSNRTNNLPKQPVKVQPSNSNTTKRYSAIQYPRQSQVVPTVVNPTQNQVITLNEPEEIFSDPIRPVALTRVEPDASRGFQLTQHAPVQKSNENSGGTFSVRKLPPKSSSSGSNIQMSFVENSKTGSKIVTKCPPKIGTVPAVGRPRKIAPKIGPASVIGRARENDTEEIRKSTVQLKPTTITKTPQVTLKNVSQSISNSGLQSTVRSTSTNLVKNLMAAEVTIRSVPLNPKCSAPKPSSVPAKPQEEAESSPVRVTRQRSFVIPQKPPEPTRTSNPISKVVKVINLNTKPSTSTDDIFSSEKRSPFTLPVTEIPAFDENDDESSNESDRNVANNDSYDPSDPLSVKTVVTIDLDEDDPLNGPAPVTKSSSSASSRPGPTRRGSLPFPSTLIKRR
uniref:CSON010378 protein n=1 Tax=Culicoides sonorensis TaxID=179676 RepID=A0A336LYE1_CULSO